MAFLSAASLKSPKIFSRYVGDLVACDTKVFRNLFNISNFAESFNAVSMSKPSDPSN
jgi:hypothetical protein